MKKISSYNFKNIYKELGIKTDDLYCVMLEVDTDGIELPDIPKDYFFKSKEHSWIDGYVGKTGMHCTLLYGLLENVKKEQVEEVLKGWDINKLKINKISKFAPETGEEYYCVIGEVEISPELTEGHARCEFLPHINTFPGYKAHVTLAYIKKDEDLLQEVIDLFSDKITGIEGESLAVKEITYDNNSGKKEIIKI